MVMDIETVAQEVQAADEARYQALYAQDVEALAGMLHEQYLHTHANGKSDDKAAFLASIKEAKYRFVSAERTDIQVRLAGTVAILSGLVRTTIETTQGLKTMRNAFVTVWSKAESRWLMLHWQATPQQG